MVKFIWLTKQKIQESKIIVSVEHNYDTQLLLQGLKIFPEKKQDFIRSICFHQPY